MRKEFSDSFTPQENGSFLVKARTPKGEIFEYEISAEELFLDVFYLDTQGIKKKGRVFLQPVTARVIRVDKILPSAYHLFFLAALNCYSGLCTFDLIAKAQKATKEDISRFLKENIISPGHWSVLEHRGPSFLVEGISRACSHQFVRHRLLTFSQQSQRYLDFAQAERIEKGRAIFPFVIPPSIRWQPPLVKEYLKVIKNTLSAYYSLRVKGAFPEDARFLFPNAAATRIVVSGNPRVWLEIIPKRTCARAQWEIDVVVTEIARQLWEEMPDIFEEAGPPCSRGKCDQGKRSCGAPLNKPLATFFNDSEYPHDSLVFGMR